MKQIYENYTTEDQDVWGYFSEDNLKILKK